MQLQPENSVKADSGSEQDTATSDDINEVEDNPRARYQKRKSILQPSGSKFSKKAAGRRRSLPPIDVEVTDQDVEAEPADSGPAEEELSAPPASDQKQISSHTRSHRQTTEADPGQYHEYLPRKYVNVKVAEYDLPSCRPEGPGDLWTCPFDTCNHKVPEASSAAGNASIKDHFEAHAQEAQAKIDLVYKESRPYLPVEFVSPLSFFPIFPFSPAYVFNPPLENQKSLIPTQKSRPSPTKLRSSPRHVSRLSPRQPSDSCSQPVLTLSLQSSSTLPSLSLPLFRLLTRRFPCVFSDTQRNFSFGQG